MKETINTKQLRNFGLVIGFGFPILIGWLLASFTGHGLRIWTFWVGIPSLILGILAPRLLNYPYRIWMALGHALGWINSRLILGLVYIIVLQPIAYTMRLFRYDPLKLRRKGEKTYRENRKSYKIDFTRIF
tara:strand:- start:205 stop:597 length:393 start_codon:yes stop_codon:yes gene_type:complete